MNISQGLSEPQPVPAAPSRPAGDFMACLEVLLLFLRLGCLSFGGPVAHLGYFRDEFVERRRWLSDADFAPLVALAQLLPGPASSQCGFAIGVSRAGLWGGFAAWIGFTLPSALLMLAFALGRETTQGTIGQSILHGLQLVSVAIVAQAVVTMRRTLAPDLPRLLFATISAVVVLVAPPAFAASLAIACGAIGGYLFLPFRPPVAPAEARSIVTRKTGVVAGISFLTLLALAFFMRDSRLSMLTLCATFFRVGAMVFGGGHVVLPLLSAAVVTRGWITPQAFLAGYGAAQAMPGPLFTFAAYLGATAGNTHRPLVHGVAALVAIFLPGLLLMSAILPFWNRWRQSRALGAALQGVNASVVGVLLAALYRPVWVDSVHTLSDVMIASLAFVALTRGKTPPWVVVVGVGVVSALVSRR